MQLQMDGQEEEIQQVGRDYYWRFIYPLCGTVQMREQIARQQEEIASLRHAPIIAEMAAVTASMVPSALAAAADARAGGAGEARDR